MQFIHVRFTQELNLSYSSSGQQFSLGSSFLFLAAIEQTYSPVTHITWESVWGLAYLGIFAAAIANTTFSISIKNIGPTKSVVMINLVPLLAIVFSFLLLDEIFSYWYLVAFSVTFAGVLLVNKS